jgi:hypothetical protein
MTSVVLRMFLLAVLLSLSSVAVAEKTDVVFLQNGDRLTGEAKSLFRGKLEFSTDHMGTIFIDWEDIREIVSTTGQSVELTNGQRFYGPLGKPENSEMMVVETEAGAVGVSTLDVIGMYPVEAGFWERLDLTASLGFTWDKGSNVGKYNLEMDAAYRDPRFLSRAGFSTEVTTQEGRDDTTRANAYLNHMQFRPNKRFILYFGNVDNNDELGVDLRVLGGAGYGWAPIRSQRNWFALALGLDVNHEIPTEGDAETNLEAVGVLNYEYFKYSDPERSFATNLMVFPSITDFGRVRVNFDTNFNLEFISDLFWKMSFFATYDSEPISLNASSSDYGVTSSLSYKF